MQNLEAKKRTCLLISKIFDAFEETQEQMSQKMYIEAFT